MNTTSLSAGDIAAGYPISRPAVSQHLRVLREAGLVSAQVVGRLLTYHLEPSPLRELDAWLDQIQSNLPSLMDVLETEVYRTRKERRQQSTPSYQREEQTACLLNQPAA